MVKSSVSVWSCRTSFCAAFRRRCSLLVLASLASGCATYESWPGGSRSERDQPPAPVVRPVPQPDSNAPAAPDAPVADAQADLEQPSIEPPPGPAGFLLEQAQTQRRSGDLDGAATSIERAMRIQPGNPWLSFKLGEVRLEQGNGRQAELLAQRALAQAGADRRFAAQCWLLTSRARAAMGDTAGAQAAAAKASQ